MNQQQGAELVDIFTCPTMIQYHQTMEQILTLLNIAQVIKAVISLVTEEELGTLEKMGHKQS